jgi:hypothetical protein
MGRGMIVSDTGFFSEFGKTKVRKKWFGRRLVNNLAVALSCEFAFAM